MLHKVTNKEVLRRINEKGILWKAIVTEECGFIAISSDRMNSENNNRERCKREKV